MKLIKLLLMLVTNIIVKLVAGHQFQHDYRLSQTPYGSYFPNYYRYPHRFYGYYPRCEQFEILNHCGSSCVPEPSCQNRHPVAPEHCIMRCVMRCECNRNYGYIRDELTGKCIPTTECLDYSECQPFEVWNYSASPCLPEPTCQNRYPLSLRYCQLTETIARCECNKELGYIRNAITGICVKIQDCPTYSQCQEDQVLNTSASICFPEPTCHNQNPQHIPDCKDINFVRCECDRDNGYIRDEITESCITMEACLHYPPCGPFEILNTNALSCTPEPTYQNQNPLPIPYCIDVEINRCECDRDNGYIRDEITSSCIKIGDPGYCGLHEIFNECASLCNPEPTCNDMDPVPLKVCPKICIQRCECDKQRGFIREYIQGRCININDCLVCNADEVLNPFASTCIPEPTCLNQNPLPLHFCSNITISRCECDRKNGYIRGEITNTCVKRDQCPSGCPRCPSSTEVLNICASSCILESTCQHPIPVIIPNCITSSIVRCECDRDAGYIRDETTGDCILVELCSHLTGICGPHEILNECASLCNPQPTCSDMNPVPLEVCPDICIRRCECDTQNGFIREYLHGNCINICDCPGRCNKPNEIFNECASCIPEPTCQNRDPPLIICPLMCYQRCECNALKGYIRDEISGECVLYCPPCGINEYEGCEPCCPLPTCQDPNVYACKRICPLICRFTCLCERGYLRDTVSGKCVREELCGVCGLNEEMGCMSCCNDQDVATCDNLYPQVFCECFACNPVCVCREGYVRNKITQQCVLPEDCPTDPGICGPHEHIGCLSCCSDQDVATCDNLYPQISCLCLICTPGCVCDKGFVRNKITQQCVLPQSCPLCPGACGPHEHHGCLSCCDDQDVATCDNLNPQISCQCFVCTPGCVCDTGYVRNKITQECVLPEMCLPNPEVCGSHEHQGCLSCCNDQDVATCDNLDPEMTCYCFYCNPGCVCDEGYVRNKITQQCVLPHECPVSPDVCDKHEHIDCLSCCEDLDVATCDNLCPEVSCECADCTLGCVCDEGYVRNRITQQCVLPHECSNAVVCGPHQREGCLSCCNDQDVPTCDNLYPPIKCKCAGCTPACVCEEGYVRDIITQHCVLPEECPLYPGSCNKLNEVFNDCATCIPEPTCQNKFPTKKPCPKICYQRCECDRKKGYIRDESTGECVKHCPPCGKHEYQDCTPCCPSATCQDPTVCRCDLECACNLTCLCLSGYLRDTISGDCVPEQLCIK